jgi:hypothetical protein
MLAIRYGSIVANVKGLSRLPITKTSCKNEIMKNSNKLSAEIQNGNLDKPMLSSVFLSTIDKQQKFLIELKELLKKYNAELSVNDNNHYEDQLVVEFNYDNFFFEKEGTGIIPDLVLGRWEDGR